jgi:guanosine-3',5'-bis(diphosphate) 3'-pyrophosphohydrolase
MDYAAAIREHLPAVWRGSEFDKLLAELGEYLSEDSVKEVAAAYQFSAAAHEGQQRQSGEPYITHPVAVARILAGLHLDAGTIKAALLHDVLEDTAVSLADIETSFGQDVALLVDGVSKLDKLHFDTALEAQAESFRKMLLAMVKDLRVILVKLADRTHNMRTIDALPPAKRRRIAKETLDIYAPIANRLGIYSLKVELEDLGFASFAPFRYRVLERAVRKARGGKQHNLAKLKTNVSRNLEANGIDARIIAREKHLYSIYSKMRRKRIPLSEIADVNGLRIVVCDIDTCYRVLGLIHQLYKPMPGRFKDYIAIPRVNGYQSLHTTLFGPSGVPLEVQIRTEDMDKLAERGIAAHWQYKAVDKHTYSAEARAREWLTGLIEMQKAANYEEFLETVKVDLFPDKVYVFTPKGDIMRLPRGATVVDFAYAVHTDVGDRCVAAKIDRRPVPLKTILSNGESVEIMTARGAKPNPNWVNFVATAKARNAIRAYLKGLRQDEARKLGRRLLDQALLPFELSIRKLKKAQIAELLSELGEDEVERIFEQVGLGERLAPVVAALIAQQDGNEPDSQALERKPLQIAGTEGLVVNYSRCCNPIPGDDIIGFLSSGRGVIIHRTLCPNVADFRKHPTKWIPVDWKSSVRGEFQSEIQVRTMNRVGLLAEVAGRISATQSNIDHVTVESDGDASTLLFRLKVRDRRHLAQVIRSIRTNPDVIRVTRLAG